MEICWRDELSTWCLESHVIAYVICLYGMKSIYIFRYLSGIGGSMRSMVVHMINLIQSGMLSL